jgi:N-acetylneuraminic acid mutarotase
VGDDLWRFDSRGGRWDLLEEETWSLDYGPRAKRPGSRLLGSFAVVDDHAYLFGGLAVLEPEFVLRALNDFWRYHVPSGRWELIHPDTGWCNFAHYPSHPPIRGAHSMVALGHDLYLFGGWPGTVPVFTVNDLWRYDTLAHKWEQCSPWRNQSRGAGYGPDASYPGSRYCANLFAHGDALYLFSGRDTGARSPEFFNDLWRYEPDRDLWTLLQPTDPGGFDAAAQVPAARYGSGHASLDDHLYLFGGHNGTWTGVERNGQVQNFL